MPDRALIALLPAAAGGFLCGVIASVLQFSDTRAFWLGAAAAAVVFACGLLSVAGRHGPGGEVTIVAVLRALCAVACFVFLYLGLLAFLRDGQVGAAFGLWIAAGIFAVFTTRFVIHTVHPG